MHYHFTTVDAMREAIARGEFIEHAEVQTGILEILERRGGEARGQSRCFHHEIDGFANTCSFDKVPKQLRLDNH